MTPIFSSQNSDTDKERSELGSVSKGSNAAEFSDVERDAIEVVFAGGGTAGHIEPALAVADELVERGLTQGAVHFIGSERGIENRLVPERGYSLSSLPGRGIVRRLALRNVKSTADLGRAGIQSLSLLRALKPKIVVTVGGYASLPVALAASLLKIPILVMEQNSVPGASNLVASKVAEVCAVSFTGTDLPNAVLTGNPCRTPILKVDRHYQAEAKAHFDCDRNTALVAVVGGSLGALSINQAVFDAAPKLAAYEALHIHHIVGKRDWPLFGEDNISAADGPLRYKRVKYEKNMHKVYAAADLLIARAGATTVAEVALTGTPTVFIPLPHAPGDHQRLNAKTLSDKEAALLIDDSEFDARRFIALIDDLKADPNKYRNMGYRAKSFGYPKAKSVVAELVDVVGRLELSSREVT